MVIILLYLVHSDYHHLCFRIDEFDALRTDGNKTCVPGSCVLIPPPGAWGMGVKQKQTPAISASAHTHTHTLKRYSPMAVS